MRSLPKDSCLGPVPVDISDLIEERVNFDESHLASQRVSNDTLCSNKEQIRAASVDCTARNKPLKHQFSCLAPSPPTRKARAEMLKPIQMGGKAKTPLQLCSGDCTISLLWHSHKGSVGSRSSTSLMERVESRNPFWSRATQSPS